MPQNESNLSNQEILEFQNLYRDIYGITLSYEDAIQAAEYLIEYVDSL